MIVLKKHFDTSFCLQHAVTEVRTFKNCCQAIYVHEGPFIAERALQRASHILRQCDSWLQSGQQYYRTTQTRRRSLVHKLIQKKTCNVATLHEKLASNKKMLTCTLITRRYLNGTKRGRFLFAPINSFVTERGNTELCTRTIYINLLTPSPDVWFRASTRASSKKVLIFSCTSARYHFIRATWLQPCVVPSISVSANRANGNVRRLVLLVAARIY